MKQFTALAMSLLLWVGLAGSAAAKSKEDIMFSAMECKGCTLDISEYIALGMELKLGMSFTYRLYSRHAESGRFKVNANNNTVTLKNWGKCK